MTYKLPEGWKEVKLIDITEKIGSGATPRGGAKVYIDEGISLIRSQNILDFKFSTDGLICIDEDAAKKLNNVEVFKDDILINITGDSVARTCLVPDYILPARVNQHVSIIRTDEKLAYYKYINYKLQDLKTLLLSYSSSGATRKALTKSMLENLKINLPPINEQKLIADTLSSLDNKIELNNKINENLEQQAQAIFKHWFIDFEFPDENGNPYKSSDGEMVESELGMIPKGWEVNPLDDFIERIDNRGKTPPYEKEKTEFPLIDVGTLRGESRVVDYNKVSKYVSGETYENWFRNGHPKNNDILISTVGSLAEMKLFIGDIGCIAQNVVAMRTDNISPFYLYEYLKFIKNDLISYDIGTVQPSIKITHIIKHLLILPTEDILSNFHNVAEKITSKIYNSNLENQNLSQLRDTLLPKLMSGELRIPLD